MSKLVHGNIPAHTECPYRIDCRFAKEGTCKHKGKEHTCEFSCATARLYAIMAKPTSHR